MNWPRGKYNGRRIVGFGVKFRFNILGWWWAASWNFGCPYLHIGPFHFWLEVEYD